jgi:hemerythrin-like metal-binding protein
MKLPKWDEDCVLGNEVIDHEHQRLLELMSWIERELLEDRVDLDLTRVNAVVDELTNHVTTHFLHEEGLMASLPTMPKQEKKDHKASHQQWRKRILTHVGPLRLATTDLERRALLTRLLIECKEFWEDHFVKIDRKLELHIRGYNLANQAKQLSTDED